VMETFLLLSELGLCVGLGVGLRTKVGVGAKPVGPEATVGATKVGEPPPSPPILPPPLLPPPPPVFLAAQTKAKVHAKVRT